MDNAGRLYLVNEAGGGSAKPQLWVYESGTPTAAGRADQPGHLDRREHQHREPRQGRRHRDRRRRQHRPSTGADAAFFEIDANVLYLKAGTVLNRTTKPSYDGRRVGATPERDQRAVHADGHGRARGAVADRLRGLAVEQRQQPVRWPTGSRSPTPARPRRPHRLQGRRQLERVRHRARAERRDEHRPGPVRALHRGHGRDRRRP